jgi:hypothetical protein
MLTQKYTFFRAPTLLPLARYSYAVRRRGSEAARHHFHREERPETMGDEWEQNSRRYFGQSNPSNQSNPLNQEELERRLEEIRQFVTQGANEAQQRIKRVVERANDYWQQAQVVQAPRQPSSVEEQRIRQLANLWSRNNWRVAKDLGTYMDISSWNTDEVWEVTVQTRWETRSMETITAPYAGRPISKLQPLLPAWDYELPPITGLKAPTSRIRLEGLDEIVACTACNGTGRALCITCNGRGWVVCPDCKGRTKKRCATCRGRGYVADWTESGKKPFFQRQAENVASSFSEKVADVFDGIRQQGVPIPNPVDTDPANKGKTIPCPDCINGEVDCSCGNGKRVCTACEGAKMTLCANCNGTGKVVRHREIVRRFDLRTQIRIIGESAIPSQSLLKASGELIYNAEVNETLHPDAPPEAVPGDVWHIAVELIRTASQEKPGNTTPSEQSRATLQVIELVRIPYTRVQYRYSDQDYIFYIYDSEGHEKFYADRYPARWDRIERLVKAITADLMTSAQENTTSSNTSRPGGYRVPIEFPPYNITEEDGEEKPGKQ